MNIGIGNGVHWVDGNGVCHPAIVAAGGAEFGDDADVIQMDAVSLLTIVPLRHNGVASDNNAEHVGGTANRWHERARCDE